MVVSSLVMAAGVAVTALVAMLGRMPFRSKAGHGDGAHHEPESGASQLNLVDIIFIVIFAVAGGFAFNVLANAGGG